MFKHRLLTAAILLPLLIILIYFLPFYLFAIFIALIVSLMMREWLFLMHITRPFVVLLGSCIAFVGALLSQFVPALPILILIFILWLCCAWSVLKYLKNDSTLILKNQTILTALGFILFIGYAKSIFVLIQYPPTPWWLLCGIFIVWAADIGAYTLGRLFGNKSFFSKLLAPSISPKKTWIGFFGGLIGGILVAILLGLLIPISFKFRLALIVVSPLIILFSILGDLFESLIKRKAGVKDSGRLLPGHGGFLDRLDSTVAALPILALLLLL